jgi:hypothetical protein
LRAADSGGTGAAGVTRTRDNITAHMANLSPLTQTRHET